jgi:hypothetical protein
LKLFWALRKDRLAKNLYTDSKRLNFSCRMTWDWSEGANFYSRQILILPNTTKSQATAGHEASSVIFLYLYFSCRCVFV